MLYVGLLNDFSLFDRTGCALDMKPDPEELRRKVEAWVDLLVEGDYEGAFSITRHDAYYQWTPDRIRKTVGGYGDPEPRPGGEIYKVTERAGASGIGPRFSCEIEGLPDSDVAHLYYDLPLNGEWSDLTVTFSVRRDGNEFLLFLREIHVF